MQYAVSLMGGTMIGLAASLLMMAYGKICGLSGIFSGLLPPSKESWRWIFLVGFLSGSVAIRIFKPDFVTGYSLSPSKIMIVSAGLLVGVGTRMSGGCTSGHGVCGIARFSKRSIVATIIFMVTGIIVVFLRRGMT